MFEANVSANITRVFWYVDGELYQEVSSFPYRVSWKPRVGEHALMAYGITGDGGKIKSEEVNFSVVEFKENEDY